MFDALSSLDSSRLTKQLNQATKKKKVLFKRAKQTGHRADYEKYKRFRNKLMRESKQKYLKGLKFLNKKQFWKAVKNLNQQKTSIPTLSSEHGTNATPNHEKTEMLNNFSSNCFNHSAPPLSFTDHDDLDAVELTDMDDFLCTVEYVEHQLDTSKANGPDGISARMLRETAKSIAPSITNIFNLSLKTGSFPTLWKTSHVVPIPKSENRTSPSNYTNRYLCYPFSVKYLSVMFMALSLSTCLLLIH